MSQNYNRIIYSIGVFLALAGLPPALSAQTAPEKTSAVQLIHELGCKGCHRIQDQGASLAPDLTQVGSRMTPTEIQQRLKQHGNQANGSFRPAYRSLSPADSERISRYLHQLK